MGIERLDPHHVGDVRDVASLHGEHLPDTPAARMGAKFLREFYYATLIEDRLLDCVICRVDRRIVGFLGYTRHPYDFIVQGVRRHFGALAGIALRSLAGRTTTIENLSWVMRIMHARRSGSRGTSAHRTAEALALAVLPAFQRHVPPGGRSRVTIRLFEAMAEHCRSEGIERILFLVQPSNRASNILFSSIGCALETVSFAGESLHRYTYEVSGARSASARHDGPR